MRENRKFPRLDLYYEGTVDIPLIRGERMSLPILVTSVSPEGVSIAASDVAFAPRNGTLVTVHFADDGHEFVLPMSVAWQKKAGRRTEFGLKLLLDHMPPEMASTYARWIVERFKTMPDAIN